MMQVCRHAAVLFLDCWLPHVARKIGFQSKRRTNTDFVG